MAPSINKKKEKERKEGKNSHQGLASTQMLVSVAPIHLESCSCPSECAEWKGGAWL